MRSTLLILLLMAHLQALGQFHSCDFRSPVSQTIISSGSFGEPRSAHFHSGIDVKPRIGEGKDSIYAIADGYVSRIKISPDGYGNALYIDHPCGYTSVYAHLYDYSESLRDYADQVRVATQKSAIDQYPPPSSLPVKKGEFIGLMGNSGNSFGAHLHFEIRSTRSEVPINPVLFGIGPKDNIPPVIRGLIVYELDNRKKVMDQKYFPAKRISRDRYELDHSGIKTSWPLIGFGLHVYDQANGAANHNGIHKLSYAVNGEERFRFDLDSIPFDLSRFMHSHMDYGYKKQNKYVHKCYKDENNLLELYRFSRVGAVLIPNEIVSDVIKISAADIFGNKSTLSFRMKGSGMALKPSALDSAMNVPKADTFRWNQGAFSITMPPHTFLHNERLEITDSQTSIKISGTQEHIPLFKKYEISSLIANSSKEKLIYVKANNKGQKVNYGGVMNKDRLFIYTNDIGEYQIVRDDTPPTIQLLNVNRYTNVTARVLDNYKTKGSDTRLKYECLVDGSWVPIDYDEKRNLMIIDRKWILKGKKMQLTITDYSGNVATKEVILR